MAAGTAAHADTTMISQDNFGMLNGMQTFAPVQSPVNLCGLATATNGMAVAGCEGGSAASLSGLYDATMISSGNFGTLNGMQTFAPVQSPLDVCGIAASMMGQAFAGCEGGTSATLGQDRGSRWDVHHFEESESLPEGCGSNCTPPPAKDQPKPQPPAGEKPHDCPPGHGHGHGHHGSKGKQGKDDVTMMSSGNFGVLNGMQIYAPVQSPVDVSGIAQGVFGQASAWSVGGSSARM